MWEQRPAGAATWRRLLLLLLTLLLLCTPTQPAAPGHSSSASWPWSVVQEVRAEGAAAAAQVAFAVAVRERNRAEVARVALAVSDPRSAAYGRHLTAGEVKALSAPSAEDASAVRRWIASESGCEVVAARTTDRLVHASCTVAATSRLFKTSFQRLVNLETQQRAILASSDITVPEHVKAAVAAVFGLQGLPLPRRRHFLQPIPHSDSATLNVTPPLIADTYGVHGVTVDRRSRNRQAVVEFQGSTANVSDLRAFFSRYVPGARPEDGTIHAFVGDLGSGSADAEASLDIQYLMGVAPGISTDFYMYSDLDLCTGLKMWASQLLEDPDPPLVNSISYGIQTNLSAAAGTPAGPDYGCTTASIASIDDDLAKLAARGLSIIVASGDDGSGYSLENYCAGISDTCMLKGTKLTGLETTGPQGAIRNAADCCSASFQLNASAFTYTGPAAPPSQPRCTEAGVDASATGQVIVGAAHWGVPTHQFIGLTHTKEECCTVAEEFGVGYTFLTGTTSLIPQIQEDFPCLASGTGCCIVFDAIDQIVANATAANGSSGTNPLAPPGVCQLFSKVSGRHSTTADSRSISGGTLFAGTPRLFPSWPASSPWVTAVGATRIALGSTQKKGEQVASQQFGSGGGFSAFVPRDPVAAFQEADTESYLRRIQRGKWPIPPMTSVDTAGRATPDVAALGEGFVVVQNGVAGLLSGTSASAPVFAAIVSLLNEARLQRVGGRPMGFLNPWLYQYGNLTFRDVVDGTNALDGFAQLGSRAAPMAYGWNATVGWDAVTGLGVPDFQRMLQLIF